MRASRAALSTAVIIICIDLCAGSMALAAHETGAYEKSGRFGFDLKVGYNRTLKRGALKRELAGKYADGIHMVKDLRFSHVRHLLNLRAEASFLQAFTFHMAFPIVLSDTRELGFAQNGGDDCGTPPEKHCVTLHNSTLIRDGYLPHDVVSKMGDRQVTIAGDNRSPGMFYLPKRSGIDQMYIGISGAPMSQQRDPTKPTWVLGFEARISIGEAMAHNPYFDPSQDESPLNPKGNSSVGRGVHQLHWWTTVSKRYKYFDPWMTFFYIFPVAKDSSLYKKTTFDLSGQERSGPRQRGGVEAGVEIIPWEQPKQNNKLSIELRAKLEGVFEGRGYSEMWEVFANSPVLTGPCRPSPDSLLGGQRPYPWDNGTYCADPGSQIPFPGISSIENHAVFNAAIAINLDLTRYIRARLGLSFGHEQQHFITFGDAGKDIDDEKGITYRNEKEVNPMYRPFFDSVGRRWRVGETTVFDVFVSLEGRI